MKRFKKMIINGADFTLKNEVVKYNDIKKMEFKTLEQCYNKCSYYKYKVFNYWNNILNTSVAYGIRSYNANMITLHSVIVINNKLYYAYITKSYNNLYEVVE